MFIRRRSEVDVELTVLIFPFTLKKIIIVHGGQLISSWKAQFPMISSEYLMDDITGYGGQCIGDGRHDVPLWALFFAIFILALGLCVLTSHNL